MRRSRIKFPTVLLRLLMTTSTAGKSLCDALLEGLGSVPGTREFHVHVLQTLPRRNTSLYRYAQPRPKIYVQDVLVLLSESGGEEGKRVLVAGIEANVYHIPATSSAILYVCKVDSTGQSRGRSATKHMVEAFLRYYADPKTRPVSGVRHLWIQLFARAQGQYLFAESQAWEGKRPLRDVQLCGWWKEVLGTVAKIDARIKAYYMLPGYSQLEAEQMLKEASSEMAWEYGHPYHVPELPCPRDSSEGNHLGHTIPYFEDDPKSRFLDEMALSTGRELRRPVRKRARTEKTVQETVHVTVDDFWERMSFRQECVTGAVTGFFTVVVVGKGETVDREAEGHVTLAMHKRVRTALTSSVSFATAARAVQATETIERLCREVGCLSGVVAVQNGNSNGRGTEGGRGSNGVTLLAARRKKK